MLATLFNRDEANIMYQQFMSKSFGKSFGKNVSVARLAHVLCLQVLLFLFVNLAALAAETASGAASVQLKRSSLTSELLNDCRLESFTLFSELMQREIAVRVVLPPAYDAHPEKQYPILYALHGRGAPYTTFSDMFPLRRALAKQPMIVVMFDAGYASFYVDALGDGMTPKDVIFAKPRASKKVNADRYAEKLAQWEALPERVLVKYSSFFFNEYVPTLDQLYRVKTSQRAITGFSMGGFGAMHLCLQRPDYFTSVSGLSAAFYDAETIAAAAENGKNNFEKTLGVYTGDNQAYAAVFHKDIIKQYAADAVTLPPFFEYCGTEDFLLSANQAMGQTLKDSGFAITYKEGPGKHDWKFWVGASAEVIDFHWQHFHK